MPRPIEISASLMCADYRRLGEQIRELDAAGIDRYHLDVIDGHFVPNFGISLDLIRSIRSETNKPFDAHLAVVKPEQFVEAFAQAGCQTIIIHQEATPHLRRLVQQIRQTGCQAGIALDPATSIEPLQYLLPDLAQVIVLTVDAGFAAQPFTWRVIPKMAALSAQIEAEQLDVAICADGGINQRTIPAVVGAGASILVLGSTGLFGENNFAAALRTVREQAAQSQPQVKP
ncbi:MAG: ribulose-phosphate 3-epimerase [Anaerolineae bacterium]|nr:ribulose-phosphate 3-epimerase [Anaerolineae bacterium]